MMDFQVEQLKALPLRPDMTWQGRLVQLPFWVKPQDGSAPSRPLLPMWVTGPEGVIGKGDWVPPEEAHPDLLWKALIGLATHPELAGYRPGRVEMDDEAMAERFGPALAQAGIETVCCDRLPALEAAVVELAENMRGTLPPPGWSSGQGVSVEGMRGLAEAAEAFFKARPWRHLGDADLLQIESPQAPEGMAYATVLGAAGLTFGLSFYETAEQKWVLSQGGDEAAREAVFARGLWSVTNCDITTLPIEDGELWQTHDLPLADPSSYPLVMHYQPDRPARRPDADRLAFVEAVLRAVAASSESEIDTGRWSMKVSTAGGPVTVTLALPDLLDPPDFRVWLDRGLMPDRRKMDRTHAQMARLMEGHSFENADELNAMIQRELVGKQQDPGRFPPRNDLERAQALCFEAFDVHGRRRLQLARQAVAISPDCADAHVLLAEAAVDPEEALAHYRAGMEAGERVLGRERFEQDAGHFWGLYETRPYMRARFGLAQTLAVLDQLETAVEHYHELLRLNPGDNQGVRYAYLPALLQLGRDREAAAHLAEWSQERSALMDYARALLAYRLAGDTGRARRELARAIEDNPYVPELLLGEREPGPPPDGYAPGSPEEAAMCVGKIGELFVSSPEAMAWLEREWQRPRRSRRSPHSDGPGDVKKKPKRRKRKSR